MNWLDISLNPIMATLEGIRQILQSEMPRLKADYGMKSIGIFGSWVRGQAGPESDLDLLVEFQRPPDLLKFIALERQLSKKIGVKVDLVSRGSLKRRIGERILQEVQRV